MARESLLNDIRVEMERSNTFRPVVDFMKDSRAIFLLHDIKSLFGGYSRERNSELFKSYYKEHVEDFDYVYNLLEDEVSKQTYNNVIKVLQGGDNRELRKNVCFPQYFPKDIRNRIKFENDCVFVDCGAYVGDTAMQFIKLYGKGNHYKIIAWEPDTENAEILKKNFRNNQRVEIITKGAWNEATELSFSKEGTDKSSISTQGNYSIVTDTIDNVCGKEKVSMIKMDIEGSEMNALEGAKKTIERDEPILAICIYHSFMDFHRIIQWTHKNYSNYKIYVRAHYDNCSEVVMYAIPQWAQERT